MKFRIPLIAAALLASGIGSSAHAALEGRDLDGNLATVEAYYDTDIDITWLADANYVQTSGYDADGLLNWVEATTWAADLNFTDGVNVYANWRLPVINDSSCSGFNCTGSEMGHLYYIELGGMAGISILTSADPDLAKFTNIQLYRYWSATEFSPGSSIALIFNMGEQFGEGYRGSDFKTSNNYAWAVSSGDVGIAAVPEPETWTLLLAGLGLVGFAARRHSGAGAA